MDIQAYISSGVIESYALGMATEQEARELETLSAQYPEIKEALIAYQDSLEEYARLHSIVPPAGTKEKIWNTLQGSDVATQANRSFKNRTIPIARSANSVFRYFIAACLILLIGSVALNLIFFNKYQDYKNKYDDLIIAQNTLVANNQVYETKMKQYERDLQIMKNPSMTPVIMKGVAAHPDMLATIYWNTHSGDVYLSVNKLPPPPAGKQYQLWAIVDGKPVNAGVFDMNSASIALQKMNSFIAAQAFAITLEKQGGSASPTMSAMYVMGKA